MTVPGRFPLPTPDDVHVWWIDLETMADGADAILSPGERARAARFRQDRARARWTRARQALRQILAGYLGVSPQDVRFTPAHEGEGQPVSSRAKRERLLSSRGSAGEGGGGMSAITAKPALANDPRLRFSLAHASDRAALAVAWQREVGIDLEPIDADLDLRPLVTIACSTSERERLYSLPPERRVEAFLRLWAAKEAYLKAIGLGLFREVRSLEVGFLTGDRAVIHDAEAENAASRWGVRFIDAGADWVAALASTGAEQRTRTFAWPLPPHAPS